MGAGLVTTTEEDGLKGWLGSTPRMLGADIWSSLSDLTAGGRTVGVQGKGTFPSSKLCTLRFFRFLCVCTCAHV